jgi:hypothetical protein
MFPLTKNKSLKLAKIHNFFDFVILLGICWHHRAFAMHSISYLYPSTQTICRMSRNAMTAHSFRANEADTYPVFVREELPRVNFPFQLPTNRLKERKII